MKDIIRKIIQGDECEKILDMVLDRIYKNGMRNYSDIEILSYLALYRPNLLNSKLEEIISFTALYYKHVNKPATLRELVFAIRHQAIRRQFNCDYTPIQANIVEQITKKQYFSFSAPTSTGKSFVFRNLIEQCTKDVVVVLPSRSLIYEYKTALEQHISNKRVNILTHIDLINTDNSDKNIFIVTPERCRELFKDKNRFDVEMFLFDEAQLGNEDSVRGLYFDSIVRRCNKTYPFAKIIFAHPFVSNPEAQLEKNHLESESSASTIYYQRSVGQIYLAKDKGRFYHFGIDSKEMGAHKILCETDPIANAIRHDGRSVLIYCSKSYITSGKYTEEIHDYEPYCKELNNEAVDKCIDAIRDYIGASSIKGKRNFSKLLFWIKRGILIHHGSMPLYIRHQIENITKLGLCKICFATSTLEQGINMPFDVVYLNRFEASNPLGVKNLIGRAGRSTTEKKFDYGFVILKSSSEISKFRKLMKGEEKLDNKSQLEELTNDNDDYFEFKKSLKDGTFNDDFNLPQKQVDTLCSLTVSDIISKVLDVSFKQLVFSINYKGNGYQEFRDGLCEIYKVHVGRELSRGELHVLKQAVNILTWRIEGKTFSAICHARFSRLIRGNKVNFMVGYHDLPNINLKVYPLFSTDIVVSSIDYDTLVYDTYDYLDKLIDFKLADIYYAAFKKYAENKDDARALKLAKLIKYGTSDEKTIWMLKYGMSFEDIKKLGRYVLEINNKHIVFSSSISEVSESDKESIKRFL